MSARSTGVRPPSAALRRAQRTFWVLLAVAILAAGFLSSSLAAPAGPVTGVRVAASGVVALTALALAARVMLALARAGTVPATGRRTGRMRIRRR